MADVDFSDLIPSNKSAPSSDVDFSDLVPKASTPPSQQMLIDYQNQGLAASQRTTPIISAHMPNLISDQVYENDSGNAEYRDPQTGQVVPTDVNKMVILRDPSDAKLKVFRRTPETDEGMLSSLGRMLGMGMMGGGPAAVSTAAPAAVNAAERIGVDLPKAIATESPLANFVGNVVAKAPGGGPLVKSIDQAKQDLQGAVGNAADMAGGTIDPAVAGNNYTNAIENSFKPTVKSGLNAAYDNVSAMMDPNKLTPIDNTKSAVGSIINQRAESGISGFGKAVDAVAEATRRPDGLTFEGIKGLRTHIGEMLDSGILPEGMSQTDLRRIYGALSDDLRTAAVNSGGQRGLAAFEQANDLASKVADWKDGLRKVLGPESRSGEGVVGSIVRMAQSGASADVETLAKARSAVPKDVWSDIASTAINKLGVSRNGEWTPAAFATDFRNLSDRGRALLFSSVGKGDVLPYLSDIAEVSKKFVDSGKLANTSGTAGHNALYAAGGAVISGLIGGSWKEPLAVIGGIAGVNGTARLLARPATAASLARWSKVYSTFAKTQAPTAQIGLEIASRNLANTAASNGVKFSPGDLIRSLQAPSNASADDQQDIPRPPGQ